MDRQRNSDNMGSYRDVYSNYKQAYAFAFLCSSYLQTCERSFGCGLPQTKHVVLTSLRLRLC
jgi:hypothetical protein